MYIFFVNYHLTLLSMLLFSQVIFPLMVIGFGIGGFITAVKRASEGSIIAVFFAIVCAIFTIVKLVNFLQPDTSGDCFSNKTTHIERMRNRRMTFKKIIGKVFDALVVGTAFAVLIYGCTGCTNHEQTETVHNEIEEIDTTEEQTTETVYDEIEAIDTTEEQIKEVKTPLGTFEYYMTKDDCKTTYNYIENETRYGYVYYTKMENGVSSNMEGDYRFLIDANDDSTTYFETYDDTKKEWKQYALKLTTSEFTKIMTDNEKANNFDDYMLTVYYTSVNDIVNEAYLYSINYTTNETTGIYRIR